MAKVLTNNPVKQDFKTILLMFKIFLVTPFTNAKVECGFSQMARVKIDFWNQLGRTIVDACLRISKGVIWLTSIQTQLLIFGTAKKFVV